MPNNTISIEHYQSLLSLATSASSHDLRTPITGIISILGLMQSGDFGLISEELSEAVLELEASFQEHDEYLKHMHRVLHHGPESLSTLFFSLTEVMPSLESIKYSSIKALQENNNPIINTDADNSLLQLLEQINNGEPIYVASQSNGYTIQLTTRKKAPQPILNVEMLQTHFGSRYTFAWLSIALLFSKIGKCLTLSQNHQSLTVFVSNNASMKAS